MSRWNDCLEIDNAVQQRYIGYEQTSTLSDMGIYLAGIIDAQRHFLVRRTRPDFSIIVYSLEGQGRLLTPQQQLPIIPNSLSILPANSITGLALDSDRWLFAWLSLYNQGPWQRLSQFQPSVDSCEYVHSVYHLLSSLHYEFKRDPDDHYSHKTCTQLLLALVEKSLRYKGQIDLAQVRLKSLFDDIEQQLHYPWTVEEMAARLHYSVPHFHRLCLKYLQLSPKQYLLKLKMERARQLLLTRHYSVGQVAFSLGYSDISSFSAGFKKFFGIAPSRIHHLSTKSSDGMIV